MMVEDIPATMIRQFIGLLLSLPMVQREAKLITLARIDGASTQNIYFLLKTNTNIGSIIFPLVVEEATPLLKRTCT
jgi:hypothetical protein